ncbi:MAG: transcription elongation factor GreA [Bacilli bacterium]|jgi:transcription elongation factor GreA|nr:transcription elongation factor GreA [Bacilli bacterium]MDY0063901.1 transcription elongation factor GreA [Bacilli bacterium]
MNGKHQLTQQGLEEHKKELEKLKNVDRIRNIEELKEARAQGDLSENADYDAARDEQARIENRIKELENIIKNSVIINGTSTNNLGKTIEVEFMEMDLVAKYTLVGSLESNPGNNKISNESPLGLALLKAKIGEVVHVKTESNEFDIRVKSIV